MNYKYGQLESCYNYSKQKMLIKLNQGRRLFVLQRNSTVISSEKSEDFKKFVLTHAKNKDFWKENNRKSKTVFNKVELDALFNMK